MEEKNNSSAICSCAKDENTFPSQLRDIPNSPVTLYYRGIINNTQPRIAIVGTRKASESGTKLAQKIAYECAMQNWCVISGLAFGIDAAAHQGALNAEGVTWAVLAHGLDTIHPKQHKLLAQKILIKNGCLLSEYKAKTPALPHHFLERNRIIAGVSTAVIVIEAPRASGSLVTARHAAQQQKPVFVFPGPASSPLYEGSHELIRNGARLVRNIEDIWNDLSHQSLIPQNQKSAYQTLSPLQKTVLKHIAQSKNSVSIDQLLEQIPASYAEIFEAITHLVKTQHIEEDGLQTYRPILLKS